MTIRELANKAKELAENYGDDLEVCVGMNGEPYDTGQKVEVVFVAGDPEFPESHNCISILAEET